MSQVKLNPYVDLGLSSDPGQVQGSQPTATNDTPVAQSATSPSFGGITDLSTFGKTEPAPQAAPEMVQSSPNLYTQVNPSDLQKEEIKVVSTTPLQEESSSSFLIIAVILFLISIGAVIFFVLRYFGIF